MTYYVSERLSAYTVEELKNKIREADTYEDRWRYSIELASRHKGLEHIEVAIGSCSGVWDMIRERNT